MLANCIQLLLMCCTETKGNTHIAMSMMISFLHLQCNSFIRVGGCAQFEKNVTIAQVDTRPTTPPSFGPIHPPAPLIQNMVGREDDV